ISAGSIAVTAIDDTKFYVAFARTKASGVMAKRRIKLGTNDWFTICIEHNTLYGSLCKSNGAEQKHEQRHASSFHQNFRIHRCA
ncbi:MAG: hypothetical protein IIT64_12210, partial [Bacteroidaceae bacterium]|nr:hypothetical protein [Bacteroidaceae bacterium]